MTSHSLDSTWLNEFLTVFFLLFQEPSPPHGVNVNDFFCVFVLSLKQPPGMHGKAIYKESCGKASWWWYGRPR